MSLKMNEDEEEDDEDDGEDEDKDENVKDTATEDKKIVVEEELDDTDFLLENCEVAELGKWVVVKYKQDEFPGRVLVSEHGRFKVLS